MLLVGTAYKEAAVSEAAAAVEGAKNLMTSLSGRSSWTELRRYLGCSAGLLVDTDPPVVTILVAEIVDKDGGGSVRPPRILIGAKVSLVAWRRFRSSEGPVWLVASSPRAMKWKGTSDSEPLMRKDLEQAPQVFFTGSPPKHN